MDVRMDSSAYKQRYVENTLSGSAPNAAAQHIRNERVSAAAQDSVAQKPEIKGQGDKAVNQALTAAMNPSEAAIQNPVIASFWSTTANGTSREGGYSSNDRKGTAKRDISRNPDAVSDILSGNQGGELLQQVTSTGVKPKSQYSDDNFLPSYVVDAQGRALPLLNPQVNKAQSSLASLEDDSHPLQTASKFGDEETDEVLPYTVSGSSVTRPKNPELGRNISFTA